MCYCTLTVVVLHALVHEVKVYQVASEEGPESVGLVAADPAFDYLQGLAEAFPQFIE